MVCRLSTTLGSHEVREAGAREEELAISLLSFSCHALGLAPFHKAQPERNDDLEERLAVELVALRP